MDPLSSLAQEEDEKPDDTETTGPPEDVEAPPPDIEDSPLSPPLDTQEEVAVNPLADVSAEAEGEEETPEPEQPSPPPAPAAKESEAEDVPAPLPSEPPQPVEEPAEQPPPAADAEGEQTPRSAKIQFSSIDDINAVLGQGTTEELPQDTEEATKVFCEAMNRVTIGSQVIKETVKLLTDIADTNKTLAKQLHDRSTIGSQEQGGLKEFYSIFNELVAQISKSYEDIAGEITAGSQKLMHLHKDFDKTTKEVVKRGQVLSKDMEFAKGTWQDTKMPATSTDRVEVPLEDPWVISLKHRAAHKKYKSSERKFQEQMPALSSQLLDVEKKRIQGLKVVLKDFLELSQKQLTDLSELPNLTDASIKITNVDPEEETKDMSVGVESMKATALQALKDRIVPGPWLPDNFAKECERCAKEFGALKRKHHCRSCGYLYCDECSSRKATIPAKWGYQTKDPMRVCLDCYDHFSQNQASEDDRAPAVKDVGVIHDGYVQKKKQVGWSKEYCAVTQAGFLFSFADKWVTHPEGHMSLAKVWVRPYSKEPKTCFEIQFPDGGGKKSMFGDKSKFIFKTNSETEVQDWIKAIEQVSDQYQESVRESSSLPIPAGRGSSEEADKPPEE